MPRASGNYVENSFVKGLVTEFTGLNFPEQAVTETQNCIFNEKGRVTRRLGLDAESDYDTVSQVDTDAACNNYVWESVNGTSTLNMFVQQIGDQLHMYRLADSSALSQGYIASIDLNDLIVAGNTLPGKYECQFASGLGRLMVVNPKCSVFYIEYDSDANTFSTTGVTIRQRDTRGIDDGYVKRLTTMTSEHQYNLQNQGWAGSPSATDSAGSSSGTGAGTPDGDSRPDSGGSL